MTDMIYLDEYGNAVDDGAEIHAAIEKITDMLAAMTQAERMNWFRKSQYPYPINFEAEIDGTVYSVKTHFDSTGKRELGRKSGTNYSKKSATALRILL